MTNPTTPAITTGANLVIPAEAPKTEEKRGAVATQPTADSLASAKPTDEASSCSCLHYVYSLFCSCLSAIGGFFSYIFSLCTSQPEAKKEDQPLEAAKQICKQLRHIYNEQATHWAAWDKPATFACNVAFVAKFKVVNEGVKNTKLYKSIKLITSENEKDFGKLKNFFERMQSFVNSTPSVTFFKVAFVYVHKNSKGELQCKLYKYNYASGSVDPHPLTQLHSGLDAIQKAIDQADVLKGHVALKHLVDQEGNLMSKALSGPVTKVPTLPKQAT